jgi:hypothetical protein
VALRKLPRSLDAKQINFEIAGRKRTNNGTSAKRMADVRAVLRQDLHGGRNGSRVSFGVSA